MLLKKLGFKYDEARSMDKALLDYFRLFGGPLLEPASDQGTKQPFASSMATLVQVAPSISALHVRS